MAEDIIYEVEEPKDDKPEDGSVVDGSTVGGATVGGATVGGATGGTTGNSTIINGIPYTVPGITSVPLISGGKKDNSTWLSEQGVDFDKEYAEGKAALDYDYETSMATYGQRAEELYQMGLSNSGVSDIYQLGAFSEHIQAQNDLRLAIIDKKKQYSKLYNDYSNEWDRNYKTDSANAYNTGLSMYTGQNIDAVRQQLTSQGYDASIVEQVVSSLSALDTATLPTVKAFNTEVNKAYAAGYELYDGKNADEVYNKMIAAGYSAEAAAKAKEMLLDIPESDWANLPTVKNFSNTVEKAYAAGYELYDGKNADEVYNKLLAAGYSPDVALEAKNKLLAIPENEWANLPTVKNFSNTVATTYTNLWDQFDGGNLEQIISKYLSGGGDNNVAEEVRKQINEAYGKMSEEEKAALKEKQINNAFAMIDLSKYDSSEPVKNQVRTTLEKIYSKAVVDAVIERADNAYKAAVAPSEEEMISSGVALFDSSAYTGSEADKTAIRQQLRGTEYEKYADKIIAQLDKNASELQSATFNDIISTIESSDITSFDMSSVSGEISRVISEYGRGSEEHTKVRKALGTRIDNLFAEAFEDKNGSLEMAYGLAGKSAEDWASMDDGERIIALLSATDAWCRNGYLDDFSMRDKYFREWFENEFDQVTDKWNIIEANQLEKQVNSFYKEGFIGKSDYDNWKRKLDYWIRMGVKV